MKKLDPANQLLLSQLADGRFHSGEELGEMLSLSRASISKRMAELRRLGLDIFSVKGKGYRLASPLSLLDEAKLKESLGEPLWLWSEVGSTNDVLKAEGAVQNGAVVLAECQTAGRGRRGHNWVSPFGAHLYFSLFWQLDSGHAALQGLSLVAGVAVANAINDSLGDGVRLKWPNDLYHNGRKLGGILVELVGQANGPVNIIIGVGLNVAMPMEAARQVDQPWTDLQQIYNQPIDRTQLAVDVISRLRQSLTLFSEKGLAAFVDDWNRLDCFWGQAVVLKNEQSQQVGICRGIESDGALLLEAGGKVSRIYGGELSMRSYDSATG
ncbi:bifunctional biotin--[acetyl-CoA-carboxylase] ligase/biotin operon repressor BirA [Gallaecimonas kandeliae]|uniref:bifunctional biotin--[acetyl-CoA-carboxylase] ligase/biotin operon repressor BirA n=1 Tax=Gallaecimonas kandeliae TaxID=3029055 RepID=UPI002648B5DC|nr:bifunctional biotin--[acetyl-CoA-carboxylase] ligase/biotin operon repressor BirA [Gallaecimonas kandeliae]WKE65957.1 bifunctional biotin--[acetyl-CoA-carboxylase] ligase/biotin operon repressor BirA [Gallaecimonas kandeliae]